MFYKEERFQAKTAQHKVAKRIQIRAQMETSRERERDREKTEEAEEEQETSPCLVLSRSGF
jgi:hypothetical protein